MNFPQIIDISLLVFSVGLSTFCFILARRLKKLNDLESGIGGAIAVLVAEIERLEQSLAAARNGATAAASGLETAITRAKDERAYWALQNSFTADTPPRPRRRKLRTGEAAHA